MSLRKCCICGGDLVENRCLSCGMLMREEAGRYHLNEDRSYHEEHCESGRQNKSSEKNRSQTHTSQPSGPAAEKQTKGGSPYAESQKGTASRRRSSVHYGFGGPDDAKHNARMIIVIFVIVIAILIISAAKAYEDSKTDDLSKWFNDSASVESVWELLSE